MLGSHFNFSTHTRARIRIGRINKQATGHGAATGLGSNPVQHPQLSSIYFSTSIFTPLLARFFCKLTPSHTHTLTHTASLLVCPDCRCCCCSCCCCVYLAVKLRQLHQCCSHAGSVKIYSVQRKGKSSQMENYGCTRAAYTLTHAHPPWQHSPPTLTPSLPRSFVRLSFQVVLFNFVASEIRKKLFENTTRKMSCDMSHM